MVEELDKRISIRFNTSDDSQYCQTYVRSLIENDNTQPVSNQLGAILKEYEALKEKKENINELSDELSDQLVMKLRPFFMRSLNADKNTKIILELLNGMIFSQRIDSIFTTDDIVTTPLQQATSKVEKDTESMLRRRAENKRKDTNQ